METRLLSIQELSQKTGLRLSWLRRQVFLKKIPYLKVEGLIRFSEKDVGIWLSQKQVPNLSNNSHN